LGFSEVSVGTGLLIVKVSGPDAPPPGAGLETATDAVPAVAMSAAVVAAVRLVADAKVVGRALPFHSTVEDETKFEPVTVSVNAGPPAVAVLGVNELIAGTGLLGGGLEPPEPPPHPTSEATQTMANMKVEIAGKGWPIASVRLDKLDFRKRTKRQGGDCVTHVARRFIPAPQNSVGVEVTAILSEQSVPRVARKNYRTEV
jgi:hypothetical protein